MTRIDDMSDVIQDYIDNTREQNTQRGFDGLAARIMKAGKYVDVCLICGRAFLRDLPDEDTLCEVMQCEQCQQRLRGIDEAVGGAK